MPFSPLRSAVCDCSTLQRIVPRYHNAPYRIDGDEITVNTQQAVANVPLEVFLSSLFEVGPTPTAVLK